MTSGMDDFGEAFRKLHEAMNPPGIKQMPVWVKYVEVRAGDNIDDIVITGFKMHAAITGKKLIFNSFIEKDIPENKFLEILNDISSKFNNVYQSSNCLYYITDNSFIRLNCNFDNGYETIDEYYKDDGLSYKNDNSFHYIKLHIHTFLNDDLVYIKNVLKFHLEDIKNMNDAIG